MSTMRALLVICAVLITVYSKAGCPAKNNDVYSWGFGEDLRATVECKDKSDKCGSCSELCSNDRYSHWMVENCAKTCGDCSTNTAPMMLQSGESCLKFYKGYDDSNVLSRDKIVSMRDCSNKCVENEKCTGIFLTSYREFANMECVLVRGGELIERANMFGATKDCLEKNPGGSCADYWVQCATNANRCSTRCPYGKFILELMCRKTCQFCDDPAFTWTTVEGKKMAGKASEMRLKMDDAKAKCEQLGNSCKGVTCKRNNCKVMSSVRKLKKDEQFKSYTMKEKGTQ